MRIQGHINATREIARVAQQPSKPVAETTPNLVRQEDVVDVGATKPELSQLRAQASEVSDVRSDRVEALRAAIAEGSYEVDAEAVADKIIDHLARSNTQ